MVGAYTVAVLRGSHGVPFVAAMAAGIVAAGAMALLGRVRGCVLGDSLVAMGQE